MNEATKQKMMELRELLKAYDTAEGDEPSDQAQGIAQPPMIKASNGLKRIPLTKEYDQVIQNNDFLSLINNRSSKRKYTEQPITLDELSFLLWSTQGVKQVVGKSRQATLRNVPSAGARHPFETYLLVSRVEGLEPGLYHYLALDHELAFIQGIENISDRITEAACGQVFLGNAAVTFIWSVIPYRSEWRYSMDAHKYILLDAGHVCQNLYLACEAIGCGTCAIGAYDQALLDELIGFNSKPSYEIDNEFVIYLAPVGKVEENNRRHSL